MTSLSPFLKGSAKPEKSPAERKAESLQRVVSLLLEGIALHAFQFDAGLGHGFQTSVRKLRAQLELVDDEDSALLMAGAAIRLLEENSVAAETYTQALQNETEKAIAVLADAFLDSVGATEQSMLAVKEIERDLARARGAGALSAGTVRLVAAIAAIRDAAAKATGAQDAPQGEIDGVTGLPDSAYGAAAFAEVWSRRADYYAAVFAAERLDAINMRFGFEAGDQVLQALSHHLAQQSVTGDQLFRWRGPCIVALMRRKLSEAHVASEIARIATSRIEHAISIRNRDAIVSISTAWNVFPLADTRTIDHLVGALNGFAATRRQYSR